MSSAMPHTQLPVSKLEDARRYVRSWLGRIRITESVKATGREMAIEAICSGLQAMPVPVLNTALAKMARHALSDTAGNPAADPQEILDLLATMQSSNDEFERGLQTLGADLAELRDDVAAIHATLTEPHLTLTNAKVESNWPIADNRISALLTNNGGGSVQVDEIYLEIEDWESDTAIDYSIPLAPLVVLDLRAELSSGRAEYPLFGLNEVPPRIFEERGTGAERIKIDVCSAENLRYSLRLRIPFTDNYGGDGTLFHPPRDEAPIVFRFFCAPGWQRIDVEKLHEPDVVYVAIRERLSALSSLLRECSGLEPDLERIGIPPFPVFALPSFLSSFVPWFARLAVTRERERALAVVVGLLTHAPDVVGQLAGSGPVSDALSALAQDTEFETAASDLASQLGDPQARARRGGALLASLGRA